MTARREQENAGVWDSPHLTEIGRAVSGVPWQWRVVYLTVTAVVGTGGLAIGWWLI